MFRRFTIRIRSRHSRRTLPIHRSMNAFALGVRTGVRIVWMPSERNTSSKAASQELPPCLGRATRRGLDPGLLQDRPDSAGRDPDTEPGELALDPAVAPTRVLPGQPHDQRPQISVGCGPAGPPMRIGPAARESSDRCQRRIVSGRTNTLPRRSRGSIRASAARNTRSAGRQLGRATCRRSTASS